MSTEKPVGMENVTSISSNTDHMDPQSHQVNLNAVTSNQVSIGEIGGALSSEQKFIILRRLNYEGLTSLEDLPVGVSFMIEKIESLSEEEAVEILKEAISEHDMDPNIPTIEYDLMVKLVNYQGSADGTIKNGLKGALAGKEDAAKADATFVGEKHLDTTSNDDTSLEASDVHLGEVFDWSLQVRMEAALIEFHSPYPEVRAVTDCYDDPTIPCETPRVYLLGLIWCAIGTFINQFFSERQPGISLSTSVVQLFLYPCGLLCAAVLPKWSFKIWNYDFNLNPGPWTAKEQMLATIFYSVSGGTVYVSWNIHVMRLKMYYNNDWADFGYQTLLVLSTAFMGFGFAGIMRKFAVYPVKAMWPTILPTLALNQALMKPEKKEVINGWKISRYNFFFLAVTCSFLYFWLPDYLMGFLSTFNWMTWIAPNNRILAEVTGSVGGLGLNPIPTFDWNIINFNYALTIPFYTQVSNFVGMIFGLFAIFGVYYTNHLWTGYMPMNSNHLFTNTGAVYDVKQIVDEHSLFQQSKYENYGPPYYSAANLVLYGAFFAIYPFAIVYECFINYGTMWKAIKGLGTSVKNFRKSTFEGFDDPHTRMMTQYKEVADWVFGVVLIIAIVLAILCVEIYPTETPVWGIFFCVAINFVFLIPITAIYSTTGFSFGLNVLVELIVGYALPGNGMALIFLKALGYNIDGQAQNYITDQKMAHYAKIPPRALFRCQILSVFVHCFISLAVINFQINSIENYCEPGQAQKFTCPSANTYYSASVIWGVIGPKKVFGGIYPILQYCFLIGALLPIPCILFKIYAPRSLTKYFQPTVVIGGFLWYAPYNLSYITGGMYASFAFMYYIKKHYLTWWEKYNYVLSGALDAGVAFSSIIIFFAVQYHDKSIDWWGNNVSWVGMDSYSYSVGRLNATESAPDGYFGVRQSDYP